jgi:hypothetical protein
MSASAAQKLEPAEAEPATDNPRVPAWLPTTLEDAEAFYLAGIADALARGGEAEADKFMAAAGRADLWFLLRYILSSGTSEAALKLSRLNHPWIFDRCREVQASPDGHIDLWFREAGKSLIISYGLTIQDVICNPETTVGFFSFNAPTAKKFLGQIKREFETNALLKRLYSDVLWQNPEKEAPKWSEDQGLIVKRKGNPKEPTILASGLVDAQPTGMHFKLRVYDDVVTEASVSTPDQVKKTTEAWELSDNLGTESGKVRYIGTRYSFRDTYQTMLDRKVAKPRIYAATHNGRIDGHPVLFSAERWAEIKNTQRSKVAAQHLQNPMAGDQHSFDVRWLKSYETRPKTLNVYIMADPSKGRSATSDSTAIAVIGIATGGTKHLVDGYCHRMSLSERWTAMRDLYKKWSRMDGVQHIAVGYEQYGAQSDLEYFEERQRIEKIFFAIEELNWTRDGTKSKQDRVERLEPDFRNSRFLLPYNVWHDGKPCVWKVAARCMKAGCDFPNDIAAIKCKACGHETFAAPDIVWSEVESLTRRQRDVMDGGAPELISKAIKRKEMDGGAEHVYDLADRLIQEFIPFPFAPHDDLLDACSRIYDMGAIPPSRGQQVDNEPRLYPDS